MLPIGIRIPRIGPRVCLLGLLVAGAAGCGDGPGSSYPETRTCLAPLDGQLLFPATLDGRPETWMVVDSGAFGTAVREDLVREVENGVGVVSLDLGHGVSFSDSQVLAADLSQAEAHIGAPIDGLLGQDLLQQVFVGLGYRDRQGVVLPARPGSAPPGLEAVVPVEVPFEMVQMLPLVEGQAGDQPIRLIADTGSGVTLLTASRVDPELLAGGVSGYVWYTSYGSDPATLVRLPSLVIGPATVEGEWVVVIPDQHHLRAVFEALGIQVDGILGYPFFRHFHTGLDGPARSLLLYAYPDSEHLPPHEWDRVGIEIVGGGSGYAVDMVFSPSDAASKGVAPGDLLLSVDGQPVGDRPIDAVRLLLRGEPGDTRRLGLDRAGTESFLDVSIDPFFQ